MRDKLGRGNQLFNGATMRRRDWNGIERVDLEPTLRPFVDLTRSLSEDFQGDAMVSEGKNGGVDRTPRET